MADEPDDIFVSGEDEVSGTYDKVTFKILILNHVRDILKLASKEWTGGYYQKRNKISGNIIIEEEVYIQDTREAFGNAVSALSNSLLAYFDEAVSCKPKETEEEVYKGIAAAFEKHTKLDDGVYVFKDEKHKNAYANEVVVLKQKLFRELLLLLKDLNYLDAGGRKE